MTAAHRLTPTGEWVLLRRLDHEKTEGGIVIPESAQANMPAHAIIVATGPGHYEAGTFIEMRLKVGDKVLLHPHGDAVQVDVNGEDLALVRESSILGVATDEAN